MRSFFVERLVVLVATAARGRIGGAALVARAALVLVLTATIFVLVLVFVARGFLLDHAGVGTGHALHDVAVTAAQSQGPGGVGSVGYVEVAGRG